MAQLIAQMTTATENQLAECIKLHGAAKVREHMTVLLSKASWATWQSVMNKINHLANRV
jgi:hypothetical protein